MKNRIEKAMEYYFFGWGEHYRILRLLKQRRFDLSEQEVMSLLGLLDCSDPKKRKPNEADEYFKYLVPIIDKYDPALKFVNTYGYITETYVGLLGTGSNTLSLQCKALDKYHNILVRMMNMGLEMHPQTLRLMQAQDRYQSLYQNYQKNNPVA